MFEAIKRDLYTQLAGIAGAPQIIFANVDQVPDARNWWRADILPRTTAAFGIAETDDIGGILQVSIYLAKGIGDLESARQADLICGGFPRNLNLGSCRIDQPASVAASFFDDRWQVTPVSITYRAIS